MPEETQQFLVTTDITPSPHAPRQLTPEIIIGSDIVLTATREHRKFVVSMAPRSATSAFTLNQFARLLDGYQLLVESGELRAAATPRGLVRELANIRGLVMPADRPEDDDIDDPYLGTPEAYEAAGSQILRDINAISTAFRSL
jgi:protein-tyrosine phosphatase